MNNFIELHNYSRQSHPLILINVNHIASVENFGTAVICLATPENEKITVAESYEEVKQLIIMSDPTTSKDGEC
nr:MAG TPA: hypothetical protein [Caudoviricetes sp.]